MVFLILDKFSIWGHTIDSYRRVTIKYAEEDAMFNYELWRYKQGLSGEKPSAFVPDSPARQAKEAGYKQYLANKDLAERVSETSEVTESCYPWESNDPEPDWLVRSGREMEAIHNRYLDEIAARRPLLPAKRNSRQFSMN